MPDAAATIARLVGHLDEQARNDLLIDLLIAQLEAQPRSVKTLAAAKRATAVREPRRRRRNKTARPAAAGRKRVIDQASRARWAATRKARRKAARAEAAKAAPASAPATPAPAAKAEPAAKVEPKADHRRGTKYDGMRKSKDGAGKAGNGATPAVTAKALWQHVERLAPTKA